MKRLLSFTTWPRILFVLGVTLIALPWLLDALAEPLPRPFSATATALVELQTSNALLDNNSALDTEEPVIATPFVTHTQQPSLPTATPSPTTPPTKTLTPTTPPTKTFTPSATPTPTATPTPSPSATLTPTPGREATARLQETVLTYSCPGNRYRATAREEAGQTLAVYGWQENDEGTWLLIEDTISKPQVWLKLDSSIEVTPDDYQSFQPKLLCRVAS